MTIRFQKRVHGDLTAPFVVRDGEHLIPIPTCRCATCQSPAAAVAADLAEQGLFRCATCGALRLLPGAGADDADCVGDPPHMVPAGAPVCGPCMRRAMPDAPTDYFTDGTDDEFRDCCGACTGLRCACRIEHVEWTDPESGAWDDDVCVIHRGRV